MDIKLKDLDQKSIYKLMTSSIVPRPIAWVSTVSKEGVYNLAPFSYFAGVSSKPPLIIISIGRKDKYTKKDTLKNIEEVGDFVINIVTKELVDKMNITALPFDEEIDEFERAGLTPAPSTLVKAPRVKESPINIECKKFQIIQIEKMGLVLGEIVNIKVRDDLLTEDGYIDISKINLVGRLGGNEYCLINKDNIFSLPKIKMNKE
jgi:flavin reductase (DIM6/NTAB) family NADH-FMN oxidoreductase RutF